MYSYRLEQMIRKATDSQAKQSDEKSSTTSNLTKWILDYNKSYLTACTYNLKMRHSRNIKIGHATTALVVSGVYDPKYDWVLKLARYSDTYFHPLGSACMLLVRPKNCASKNLSALLQWDIPTSHILFLMPTQHGGNQSSQNVGKKTVTKPTWALVFNIIFTNTIVLGANDRHRIRRDC